MSVACRRRSRTCDDRGGTPCRKGRRAACYADRRQGRNACPRYRQFRHRDDRTRAALDGSRPDTSTARLAGRARRCDCHLRRVLRHDGRNPWLDGYNEIRRRWSPVGLWEAAGRGARTHRDLAAFFRGSSFRPAQLVTVETSHLVGLHDLAKRALTYSSSSPDALGENVEDMLRDVGKHLVSFSRDGAIAETVISTAQIVTR